MFTFNGVTSATMGINVNRATIQSMPTLNNQFQARDAGDGILDFGTFFTEKLITFECNFEPKATYAAMITALDTLNGYLNPKLGLKALILDETPTRQYYSRLYQGLDITKIVRTGGIFNLVFVCPDPYGYSTTETNEQFTSSGVNNFTVGGNATAKPVIELVASIPITGENITLDFNGTDILEIRGVITTSYKLVIDVEEATVQYIEIATPINIVNGLPFIELVALPELLNGSNYVDITVGSGSTFTSLDIDYYARYI